MRLRFHAAPLCTVVALSASLLAACGATPGGSLPATTATATVPAQQQATTGPTTHAFDMCTLMPDSDVVGRANYPIPFWKSEGPTDTACAYYFDDQDHATASITLGAQSYGTAEEVTSGIMQTVNDYKLDGWPTETIGSVGDEAWWLCQTEPYGECTLYVRQGTYQVSALMTPSQEPSIDNDTRKGVAISLANLIIDRLP